MYRKCKINTHNCYRQICLNIKMSQKIINRPIHFQICDYSLKVQCEKRHNDSQFRL